MKHSRAAKWKRTRQSFEFLWVLKVARRGEEDEKQGIFVLQTLPSLPPSPVLSGDRPTLFLLDWKSGRHVNCGEASAAGEEKGAVECRWTDQGEWQEVILSKT